MAGRNVGRITLDEVGVRFESLRKNRQAKASIPDELWGAAIEVARKEGLNRGSTSKDTWMAR